MVILCNSHLFLIKREQILCVCFIIHIHNSTFMSSNFFLEFRYVVDKSYYMIHLVACHNNIIIFPLMKFVCCVYKEVISKQTKACKENANILAIKEEFHIIRHLYVIDIQAVKKLSRVFLSIAFKVCSFSCIFDLIDYQSQQHR